LSVKQGEGCFEYQIFKVFWFYSIRESNPGLNTLKRML